MKSFIIATFLFIFFPKVMNAQSEFMEGYVLTSPSDTLFGVIDNKSYNNNSQYCDFRNAGTDFVTRFYPDQIYGYRFKNGKYYISKLIKTENRQVRLFVEYLVHGKLDLYYFQDDRNLNHYFVSKDTLQPSELIDHKENLERNGAQLVQERRSYIGLLNYFTSDCEAIRNDIIKLNGLDHRRLISLAEKYHNLTCKDEKCIIYEKKLSRKLKFNVYGGSLFYLPAYTEGSSLTKKAYPEYGFNILFQYTQRSEKIYLGLGLSRVKGFEGLLFNGFQVPFSINYMNPVMGLSPIVSYEFDVSSVAVIQTLKAGIKYQMKHTSVFLTGNMYTALVVKPFATSLNFGLNIDLR